MTAETLAVARPGRRGATLLTGLAAVLAALVVLSLLVGPAGISAGLAGLLDRGGELERAIFWELRAPRTLLGVMIGASLGLSGAALQGLLRNPLAEPGVIGVSGCAALGAVLTFYSGLAAAVPFALPLGAIIGALAAVSLLYALARPGGGVLTLILAGVALNSLAGALTALALNLSPNPFAAYEIVFWLLGSLSDREWSHVALAAPLMAAGWFLVLTTGRALDALTLGEDVARSLGFDLRGLSACIVVGTALSVGAAVAVAGTVGFIGLIVPHLVRPLVGHRPGAALVPSALAGASLLLAADISLRAIPTAFELKLGVVSALIGAPFFLRLVIGFGR